MTIALVNSLKAASPDTNGFTSAALNCTGANLLVVAIAKQGAGSVSDSRGNTWTQISSGASIYGNTCELWYAVNASVSSSQTFTISGTGNAPSMCVAAFSGAATSAFDQSNTGAFDGSNTGQIGSVTPSEDNEVIVALLGGVQDGGTSIGSSFTLSQNQALVSGLAFGISLAYKVQTAAGTENPTWTTTDALKGYAGVNATFKSAVAPSSTIVNPMSGRGGGAATPIGMQLPMALITMDMARKAKNRRDFLKFFGLSVITKVLP